MPHVCFAPSCAVGCSEEENTAGWEQLSWHPKCMYVRSIPLVLVLHLSHRFSLWAGGQVLPPGDEDSQKILISFEDKQFKS